jgi:hypothetical protein
MTFRSQQANEIAELIGEEATMLLCETYPGVTLYVGYKPSGSINKLLGEETAARLSKEYGGTTITVPSLLARSRGYHEAIRSDREKGLSCRQLSLKHRYTMRQVWNILAGNNCQDISPNLSFNF